jgi:hypothetical protein
LQPLSLAVGPPGGTPPSASRLLPRRLQTWSRLQRRRARALGLPLGLTRCSMNSLPRLSPVVRWVLQRLGARLLRLRPLWGLRLGWWTPVCHHRWFTSLYGC